MHYTVVLKLTNDKIISTEDTKYITLVFKDMCYLLKIARMGTHSSWGKK